MRDHFGIGLAGEFGALLLEHDAQVAKILDDAVVHDRDVFGRMRMRVAFGRLAVGGPAGVADPGMAAERFGLQPLFQILELALGAAARQVIAFQRGDAGGIVTAIFQAFERIDQQLRDRAASENADNAAHAVEYPQIVENSPNQRPVLLTKNRGLQILNNYCGLRQR